MKNITFSADEKLIASARQRAAAKGTTLNQEFRDWLAQQAAAPVAADAQARVREFDALMQRLSHIRSNGPYTRDEMHER